MLTLQRAFGLLPALLLASGLAHGQLRGEGEPLVLLVEDDWFPYAAAVGERPVGISVDLVRAAYGAVGVEVELTPMAYSRCMELVSGGQYVGCFNTPADDGAVDDQLLPEEPLDHNPAWIYKRADNPAWIGSLADLAGEPIGIVNGYRYSADFMNDPRLVREVAASDLQNLKKLAAGRLDYVVMYERVAEWLIGRHGTEMGLALEPVVKVGELALYVSFSRRHPAAATAMQQLDEGLRRIKRNGEYRRIMREWEQRLAAGRLGNGSAAPAPAADGAAGVP